MSTLRLAGSPQALELDRSGFTVRSMARADMRWRWLLSSALHTGLATCGHRGLRAIAGLRLQPEEVGLTSRWRRARKAMRMRGDRGGGPRAMGAPLSKCP